MKRTVFSKGLSLFLWLLTGCCVFLQSCLHADDLTARTKEYFAKEQIRFDENLRRCLIIPGGGCAGCIASGIYFFDFNKQHFSKSQKDNAVVFTSINSLKVLKRSLKGVDFADYNVVIDTLNRYTVDFKENIYPLIVYLDKGKIVKVDMQSPETDGLSYLQQQLEEKYVDVEE